MGNTCDVIQNLRWIQVESTLRIMRTGIENYSRGYDFEHRRLGEKGFPPLLREDPLMSETCPLKELN